MRIKADDEVVDDPKEAMDRFHAALAHIVRVPKEAVHRKRKRAKAKYKKKRNIYPLWVGRGSRRVFDRLVSQLYYCPS